MFADRQLCSVLFFRDKFVEMDLKPVCKRCYERVPDELKRRLSKQDMKKKKMPICL